MTSEVDAYLSRPAPRPAPRPARGLCRPAHPAPRLLPDHIVRLSYAMPGFRLPGPKGKMVVGYAAFAKRLGLYPHSGTVIPRLDCAP